MKFVIVALGLVVELAAIAVCGTFLARGGLGLSFADTSLSWSKLVTPRSSECSALAERRMDWCLGQWVRLGEMPPYGLKDHCARVRKQAHARCMDE